MKIAYCSAEVAPFSKTGGLGDVSWSIPKALSNINHDVSIFTPLYKSIPREKYQIEKIQEMEVKVRLNSNQFEHVEVYQSILPNTNNVNVYFIKHPLLYREGMYTNPNTSKDYDDNGTRFFLFSKAIFEVIQELNYVCDIFHANDWHSGLVPFFLRTKYKQSDFFSSTKSVFTIHNIGYQGVFSKHDEIADYISQQYLSRDEILLHDNINFMKAGIKYCDILTTVSKKYATEIQTGEFGFTLEDTIKEKDHVYGIVHGIDYEVWNPAIDDALPATYTADDLKGKQICKKKLQEEFRLNISNRPLLSVISRLAHQKGLDLLLEIFDDMMALGVQFILLGTGDPELETTFQKMEQRYSGNVSTNITFNIDYSHQIEAGADMFLMPSRYEPCGLNQMYSMLYGTVPIVRKTGGLADTVQDYNFDTNTGSGFVFNNVDSKEFLTAIKRAVKLYKHYPDSWKELQMRIMKKDFTWKKAAKEWAEVYKTKLKTN